MSRPRIKLRISTDGTVSFVHSDAAMKLVAPLLVPNGDNGYANVSIKRASHVEPTPSGTWEADLSPTGHNIVLGPFATKEAALAAEQEWIENHLDQISLGGQPNTTASQGDLHDLQQMSQRSTRG